VLGTIGRVLLFCLLFALLDIAASGLLGGPLVWLAARSGQRVEIDDLLMLGAALGATALMVRAVDVRPWRDLGLARDAARPRPVGAGWCIGFAAIGLVCALLFAVGWLRIAPSAPGSSLGAAARLTFVLVPAAFAEEVLCRGYLLTVVRERAGWAGAIGLTSLAFGLLHAANPGATVESVLLVTLAGIFLAAIRVVYDSLYAAWSAHAAWNWLMAVPLHAPVSGLRLEAPDYRTVSTGPAWITGGAWGPEGGLAAGLGMMAGLAYLYTRRRREES
jgi:membrane protease YdiL (CAAX protease family)